MWPSIALIRKASFKEDLIRFRMPVSLRSSGTGSRLELDGLPPLRGVLDSLSCVAKAEPRKRLCGITVAPITPIAKNRNVWCRYPQIRKWGSHVYKLPGWKMYLEGTYPRKV